MNRARMKVLEGEAKTMASANHGRFLAEATLALRDPKSWASDGQNEMEAPIRALGLLVNLWDTAYASRPEPKRALNDVGKWLERRLSLEPEISVADLQAELGWLRRLGKYHEETTEKTASGHSVLSYQRIDLAFGKQAERLRKLRAARLSAKPLPMPVAPSSPLPTPPPKAKEPVPMPSEFVATFADITKAREARSNAIKRARNKKPPKDAVLELVITNNDYPPKGPVQCSTVRTEGLLAVLEKLAPLNDLEKWRFRATKLEEREDGVLFVGQAES